MHLHIVGTDGSELTQIGVSGSRPAWSPDGLRVAFIGHVGEDEGLFTAALNGSLPTKILDYLKELKGSPQNVSWSPDGKRLLLTSGQNHSYVINVVNAAGSDIKTLTPSGTYRHRGNAYFMVTRRFPDRGKGADQVDQEERP